MTSTDFANLLGSRIGVYFTQEQLDFISDFTSPLLSFSLPGTGKTAAATAGLIVAEKFHRIPPSKIYAISFTRNSTNDLKNRHNDYAKAMRMKSSVNFSTLHALCARLLREHYGKLGMFRMNIVKQPTIETVVTMIENIAQKGGIPLRRGQSRNIYNAILAANSSFFFEQRNLESRYVFKRAGVSYDTFMYIRNQLYEYNKAVGSIPQGDIPLYTLELLMSYPEISQEFKDNCKVMLIDEFQDMSLLQLVIVTYLTDNLIAIGDINQQIYAFNGACQEIVLHYANSYPQHRLCNLTQSFRCADEIAEWCSSIIVHNGTGGEMMKGNGTTGVVRTHAFVDLEEMADGFVTEVAQEGYFQKSIVFLFRNNYSSILLSEIFYNKRVPFYVKGYSPLNQRPIIKDLCSMVDFLLNSQDHTRLGILSKYIPEFRSCKEAYENPLFEIMQQTQDSFLEINYNYRDAEVTCGILEELLHIKEVLYDGGKAKDILPALYEIMYDNYLTYFAHKMEVNPADMMIALSVVVGEKNYRQFIYHEAAKAKFIEDNELRRLGIRCMTVHGAKGLEADIVYIIDADAGVLPNAKKLREMYEADCNIDLAREVRNERSLAYVACSRAREQLHICYSEEIAPLIVGTNEYEKWDDLYKVTEVDYLDFEAFQVFADGNWTPGKSEGLRNVRRDGLQGTDGDILSTQDFTLL